MFTRHGDNPRRFGDVQDNALYWNFVVADVAADLCLPLLAAAAVAMSARPALAACAGSIVAPALWALNTQLGQVLPYAECGGAAGGSARSASSLCLACRLPVRLGLVARRVALPIGGRALRFVAGCAACAGSAVRLRAAAAGHRWHCADRMRAMTVLRCPLDAFVAACCPAWPGAWRGRRAARLDLRSVGGVPLLLAGGSIRARRHVAVAPRRVGRGVRRWQAALYGGGWSALAGALLSPLHAMGEQLFTAHMVEHEIVMAVAAPLLVAGAPGRRRSSGRGRCRCDTAIGRASGTIRPLRTAGVWSPRRSPRRCCTALASGSGTCRRCSTPRSRMSPCTGCSI